MKNILKISYTFLVLTFLTMISGCGNNRQLHERLIIRGVCVDKINDEFVLTLNVFDAENSGGKEEGDSKGKSSDESGIITCKGKSILDAFTSISNMTGKDPMYSQNLILIFGKETAKSGIDLLIDFFVRHYDARPSIEIFVSSGNASDVFKCKLNNKSIQPKAILNITKPSHLNMNVMGANLVDFVSSSQSDISDAYAAFLNVEDEKLMAKGTAIFNGNKLVDVLDVNATKGALLINQKNKGGTEVVKVENLGTISCTIISSKSKISVDVVNSKPEFNIELKVEANVYEIENSQHKFSSDNIPKIQEELNKQLENYMTQSINKCIKENHCDIFNFGRYLLNNKTSYFKSIQNRWHDVMLDAKYNVSVNSHIDKVGQEINPV